MEIRTVTRGKAAGLTHPRVGIPPGMTTPASMGESQTHLASTATVIRNMNVLHPPGVGRVAAGPVLELTVDAAIGSGHRRPCPAHAATSRGCRQCACAELSRSPVCQGTPLRSMRVSTAMVRRVPPTTYPVARTRFRFARAAQRMLDDCESVACRRRPLRCMAWSHCIPAIWRRFEYARQRAMAKRKAPPLRSMV